MTSKERVLRAVNHKLGDKTPVVVGFFLLSEEVKRDS